MFLLHWISERRATSKRKEISANGDSLLTSLEMVFFSNLEKSDSFEGLLVNDIISASLKLALVRPSYDKYGRQLLLAAKRGSSTLTTSDTGSDFIIEFCYLSVYYLYTELLMKFFCCYSLFSFIYVNLYLHSLLFIAIILVEICMSSENKVSLRIYLFSLTCFCTSVFFVYKIIL